MPQLKSSVAANASSIASTNLSPDSAVAATRRRWPRRMLVAVAASVLGVLPGIPSLAPVGPAVVQAAQPDQPHAAAPGTKTAPAALSSRSGTPPAPDKTAKKTDAPCETLKAAGPTWMHDLAPCLQGRLLSEIGIPGSHDSGTYGFQNGEGFGYATTQDEDITHQLNDGMRSFDIRVDYQTQGALGPGWYVNHGPIHSLTVDLGQIFADIRAWAIQPGHGQEIIRLSLVITGGDDKDDCRDFGENMGQQGLVTPNELQAYFGTNNPGEVTVGELWSLPNFNGIARVIMSNIPCLNEAIAANGGSSDNGQWASSDGYYAEQCTADGIEENDLQQYGVIKRVLPAAENRYSTGTGPAPPIQFGPPSPHGNLYELDVQLTPENPLDPGEPLDCAVTPLSLLPQDQQVLDALFGDYLAWQNLNIVHGDFVEQTNLWVGVVSSNQIPRAPDPPVITDHTTGVGQVTVAFSDRVSGTAPITSYDVQAFDQTTNRYVPGVSSPFTPVHG
jgi:hypothetical protein